MTATEKDPSPQSKLNDQKKIQEITSSVIRFGGDSGDGMQLVGDLFTSTCAIEGNSFCTLPDYPSEIRAPAGTIYGVSGFQLCFSDDEVYTPGDFYDLLVAMNPAALKVNLKKTRPGGLILVNEDSFIERVYTKAGYEKSPFETEDLSRFILAKVPMSEEVKKALDGLGLTIKEMDRCKNFFALGILLALYNKTSSYATKWIEKKFKTKAQFIEANTRALMAGMQYAQTSHSFPHQYVLKKGARKTSPGTYRSVTGNVATALGLIAASQKANVPLFLGSYPITPATDVMHELVKYPDFCTALQAEDEIAGVGSAIGASFGGALGVTNTSGPGFSLKSEFINLAVMAELPLVVINVQRAGPSTGMPTKTEQADLLQALWGRHGESPVVVLAASDPVDCFHMSFEASRIALKYMTPVILLTEGYLGNGSAVWKIPSLTDLPDITVQYAKDRDKYKPYLRDPSTLARPWAIPGTAGLEHRLGGLEKEDGSGAVSHVPENHEKMVHLRAEKVRRVQAEIPPLEIFGNPNSDILVLGWGGTFGAIRNAVRKLNSKGTAVASVHLKYLNPLPPDLGALLKKYKKVLIPELNSGQLWFKLRGDFLLDLLAMNKIQGQPFTTDEIESKIVSILGELSK